MQAFNMFSDLETPKPLSVALKKMQFIQPTPVQKAAIPPALLGKDILGTAKTGTGKTGAFFIPLLTHIYAKPSKMALILAPTRELAAQINQVLRQMSKKGARVSDFGGLCMIVHWYVCRFRHNIDHKAYRFVRIVAAWLAVRRDRETRASRH